MPRFGDVRAVFRKNPPLTPATFIALAVLCLGLLTSGSYLWRTVVQSPWQAVGVALFVVTVTHWLLTWQGACEVPCQRTPTTMAAGLPIPLLVGFKAFVDLDSIAVPRWSYYFVPIGVLGVVTAYFLSLWRRAEPYRYVTAVGMADPHAYVYVWRDKFNQVRRSIFHRRSAGPHMWLVHATGLAITLIYLLFVPTTQVLDFIQCAAAQDHDRPAIADHQIVPSEPTYSGISTRLSSDPLSRVSPTTNSWAVATDPSAALGATPAPALEAEAAFDWGRYVCAPNGTCRIMAPKNANVQIAELPPPSGAVSSTRLRFSAEIDDQQTPIGVMLTETIYRPGDQIEPNATLQFDKSVATRLLQFEETAESSWTPAPTLATAKRFSGHRNRRYEAEVRIAVLNDCSRSYRLTAYWPMGRPVKHSRQFRELLSSFRIRVPQPRAPK